MLSLPLPLLQIPSGTNTNAGTGTTEPAASSSDFGFGSAQLMHSPLSDEAVRNLLALTSSNSTSFTEYDSVSGALSSVSGGEEDVYQCKWSGCIHPFGFNSEDDLLNHISEAHIGRKATGNLCLTCGWEGCTVSTTKRDHLTSHMRVHVQGKPFVCSQCNKSFKRGQDLRKHEKAHSRPPKRAYNTNPNKPAAVKSEDDAANATTTAVAANVADRKLKTPKPRSTVALSPATTADSVGSPASQILPSTPLPATLTLSNFIFGSQHSKVAQQQASPASSTTDDILSIITGNSPLINLAVTPPPAMRTNSHGIDQLLGSPSYMPQLAQDLSTSSLASAAAISAASFIPAQQQQPLMMTNNKRALDISDEFAELVKRTRQGPAVYDPGMITLFDVVQSNLDVNNINELPQSLQSPQQLLDFSNYMGTMLPELGSFGFDPEIFKSVLSVPTPAPVPVPTSASLPIQAQLGSDPFAGLVPQPLAPNKQSSNVPLIQLTSAETTTTIDRLLIPSIPVPLGASSMPLSLSTTSVSGATSVPAEFKLEDIFDIDQLCPAPAADIAVTQTLSVPPAAPDYSLLKMLGLASDADGDTLPAIDDSDVVLSNPVIRRTQQQQRTASEDLVGAMAGLSLSRPNGRLAARPIASRPSRNNYRHHTLSAKPLSQPASNSDTMSRSWGSGSNNVDNGSQVYLYPHRPYNTVIHVNETEDGYVDITVDPEEVEDHLSRTSACGSSTSLADMTDEASSTELENSEEYQEKREEHMRFMAQLLTRLLTLHIMKQSPE